jgi:hypothetical protein
MDDERDSIVMKAIERIRQDYLARGLYALPPREITEAIYAELRRLDLKRIRSTTGINLEAAD